MVIKFNDPIDWMNIELRGIRRAYFVPEIFQGDGVCVDIGANVGGFPLIHSTRFKEIHCYEPASYTYNECIKNTKLLKNVYVYNLAVTDVTGDVVKLKSHKGGNCSGNASLLDNSEWNDEENFEMVKTISFVDIVNRLNLNEEKNYLKIDTEGSEYKILMNADLSMINYLAVEIHIQLGMKKINELMAYLSTFFSIIRESGGGGSHYEITYINRNLK